MLCSCSLVRLLKVWTSVGDLRPLFVREAVSDEHGSNLGDW